MNVRTRVLGKRVAAAMLALVFSAVSRGLLAPPEDVPIERLLGTAEKAVTQNPKSGQAHYTLARIHYLSFSRGEATLPAYQSRTNSGDMVVASKEVVGNWIERCRWVEASQMARKDIGLKDGEPIPDDGKRNEAYWNRAKRHFEELKERNWQPPYKIADVEKAQRAANARGAFVAAIALEPDNGLYVLGLASLIEEIVDWKEASKPRQLPSEIAALGRAEASELYLKAFRLAAPKDAKALSTGGDSVAAMVSYEAGEGYLRLSKVTRKDVGPTDDVVVREIEKHKAILRKIPIGPFSPMIFACDAVRGIDDLVDPLVKVDFDLRGYGPNEKWSWVKATTGLLVWDPNRSGRIESGRQLFGGYTFQIFRRDGYEALAALDDDDGDGELRGGELTGMRVWFDRNGDGVSAADEVVDLESLGIVGIAVRATGKDGIHPTNPAGIRFADGHVLPTWDWMVEPVKN